MTYEINETHDPDLKSWIESANDPNTDFPIQNLPFVKYGPKEKPWVSHECGIIIGDFVISLTDLFFELESYFKKYFGERKYHFGSLNSFSKLLPAEAC